MAITAIEITAPAEGDGFGGSFRIEWTLTGTDAGGDTYRVFYSKDGGDFVIINDVLLAPGSTGLTWDTTTAAGNSDKYKIKVTNTNTGVTDTSDLFIVVNMVGGLVVVGTGTIGTRFLSKRWPIAEGLAAGFNKQTGIPYLEEEGSQIV